MKRIICIAFVLLALCGCAEEGVKVEATEYGVAERFQTEFLFEVDGIRVYRFRDYGKVVYFTSATGRVEHQRVTRNGKTVITHHEETLCNKHE